MIILTSISPSHISNQLAAVESWLKHGFFVCSFNKEEEMEELEGKYPKEVAFIRSDRHDAKGRVYINEMIDIAKRFDSIVNSINHDESLKDIIHIDAPYKFLIINSDIIIDCPQSVIEKYEKVSEHAVCMAQRLDFDNELKEGKVNPNPFLPGFDCFLIHSKFLNTFPQSLYVMGQTHWDYWIPWTCVKKGIDIVRISEPFIYHKKHKQQFSMDEWYRMGCYMRWQEELFQYPDRSPGMDRTRGIGLMSEHVKNTFMKKLITI